MCTWLLSSYNKTCDLGCKKRIRMIARTPYKGLRGHPSCIQSSNLHFARATVLDGIFIVLRTGPYTSAYRVHQKPRTGPRENVRARRYTYRPVGVSRRRRLPGLWSPRLTRGRLGDAAFACRTANRVTGYDTWEDENEFDINSK